VLAVVILLAMVVWAGWRADAAWSHRTARDIISTGTLDGVELNRAETAVNHALARLREHPDYLDLAGHIKEKQATQPMVLGKERRELLESAMAFYRKALIVRPLWPYSWANLLAVKDKLGQVDAEFYQAIQRAAETGPWEKGVQMQVLQSGLRHWDRLPVAEQDLVSAMVVNALKVQPREAFNLVRSFGPPQLICSDAGNHVQIQRWCETVKPNSDGN
jgi:hypothetical protein